MADERTIEEKFARVDTLLREIAAQNDKFTEIVQTLGTDFDINIVMNEFQDHTRRARRSGRVNKQPVCLMCKRPMMPRRRWWQLTEPPLSCPPGDADCLRLFILRLRGLAEPDD